MKLYFMRHGKAVDAATMESDFARPLTEKGAKRVRRMAQALANMKVSPTAIFASPRVRAQQTAHIMADALGKTVTTREEVNFDFDATHIEEMIFSFGNDAEVLFVGHNPSMSEVVRRITGATVNMDVGSVVCALVTPYNITDGELAWYMNWHCVKALED